MGETRSDIPELDDWRRVYEAAGRVQAMEPWRFMEEIDIFGVQDPASDRFAFASVMGMLGEHFAIAVYIGAEGLYAFWDIQETDLNACPEGVIEPRQLQLSFEDRALLTERDHEWIKKLGLRFRGRNSWPMFRSYRPAFVPSHLDASELRLLNVVLDQILEVAPRFEADPGLFDTADPETYFLRVPTRRGDGIEWKDAHTKIRPPDRNVRIAPYDEVLKACRGLKAAEEDVELDVFWLPTAIHEGSRPFYPYTLLVVGAESGAVVGFRMLKVESSFEDMWGEVPRNLLELFVETKRVPRTIYVRSPRVDRLVAPLGREIRTTITLVDELPGVDTAKDALIEAVRLR